MEKIKVRLAEAREMVDEIIEKGFDAKSIPELGDMIRGISAIEAYTYANMDYEDDSEMDESAWLLRRIDSELQAVGIYADKWLESKNPAYKQIAMEQLKHAELLIKQARQEGTPQSELQDIQIQYGALNARLA